MLLMLRKTPALFQHERQGADPVLLLSSVPLIGTFIIMIVFMNRLPLATELLIAIDLQD